MKHEGAFVPRRIGHVNFWVRDVEAVADFYRDIVGIDEVYRRAALKGIFMSNGNTYHDVAFMGLDSPRGIGHAPGMHHFSLEVEHDKALVDGFFRARSAGYAFDSTISADVTNSCYGFDPDGNRFELYADIKPDWRSERKGAVTTGSIKWVPGEYPPLDTSLYPVNPEIVVLPDAAFHPVKVSHVVIVTSDHAAMVDHYTRIAGLVPLAGSADGDFIILGGSLGGEVLALFREQADTVPGLHHTGFALADEAALLAGTARLRERGLLPVCEIDEPTRLCVYLSDPEGQLVQMYVDRAVAYRGWEALSATRALWIA